MGGKGHYELPPASPVAFVFGKAVPEGVRNVEVTAQPNSPMVCVAWRTHSGLHRHDLQDLDDDSLTAMQVAMRFSCS